MTVLYCWGQGTMNDLVRKHECLHRIILSVSRFLNNIYVVCQQQNIFDSYVHRFLPV